MYTLIANRPPPDTHQRLLISEEHAREVIGDVDINGDGAITYDEYYHYYYYYYYHYYHTIRAPPS